jgi:hypothetical protein
MDHTQADKIISALADGCDPTTGETVEGLVLQHGDVIRALHMAVLALEIRARSKVRGSRARTPANAGGPVDQAGTSRYGRSSMNACRSRNWRGRMTGRRPASTRDWRGMVACKIRGPQWRGALPMRWPAPLAASVPKDEQCQ